jgi:hypothetical protein
MALSRPGQAVLGYTSALLLGGILGLACWSWLRHSGRDRASRIARVGVALAAGGLVLIAVGTVWRVVVAIQSLPPCSGPPSQQAQTSGRHFDAALLGEKFATWPETGLAMLYARAIGAPECRSRSTDYYVAIHANELTGGRAVNLGDIVVSPLYDISNEQMIALAAHEARHRPQWAIGTVIGGPFAFPVAYAVDDFFFPGARNHFERQAGLEPGGYRHVGHGPVLGLAQIATLCAVPVVIVVALLVARRRRIGGRVWRRNERGEHSVCPPRG